MNVKKRYLINNHRTDNLLKEKLAVEAKSLIQADVFTINVIAAVSELPKEEVYKIFARTDEHNPLL